MTDVEAATPSQRLKLEVVLTVKHRIAVILDTNSTKTVEELKDLALAEYHRDPGRYGTGHSRRTEDTWRLQFANRTNIDVGSEDVSIAEVNTRPTKEWNE